MAGRTHSGADLGGSLTVKVRSRFPIIDEVIEERQDELGIDLTGYKNHVYRMVNYALALGQLSEVEQEKVTIAGCFHDLGIWSEGSFDYLAPSIALADDYLRSNNRTEWAADIARLIGEHHKLRAYRSDLLTETFRKADLIDLSLGAIKFDLDNGFIKDVKATFPNCGFHTGLIKTACRWIVRHPLNPVPVLKW